MGSRSCWYSSKINHRNFLLNHFSSRFTYFVHQIIRDFYSLFFLSRWSVVCSISNEIVWNFFTINSFGACSLWFVEIHIFKENICLFLARHINLYIGTNMEQYSRLTISSSKSSNWSNRKFSQRFHEKKRRIALRCLRVYSVAVQDINLSLKLTS